MKKFTICVFTFVASYSLPLYAQDNNTDTQVDYNEQESQELRLALTKISLYTETREFAKASALIEELKVKYPDNPQVLVAAADLNLRMENRGSAYYYINKAHNLDPLNEDIIERRILALQESGPFVAFGASTRDSNQADENFLNASGRVFYTPTLSSDIIAENNSLESKGDVIRADGSSSPFEGDKQRATVTVSNIFNEGQIATGKLHFGNENIGAGVAYSMPDRWGSSAIDANINQPDWSFIETVVGDGTKDNISIARKQHLITNLDGVLGLGFNHYNLEDESDIASSAAVNLGLGYNYPYSYEQGYETSFAANYTVDAEYFSDRTELLNDVGGTYSPFPAVSYEIHAVTVSALQNLYSTLSLDAYAGFAKDRLGSSGPLFGGGITYAPIKSMSIEFAASRGIIGESRIGTVDQYGVNVRFKW